MSVCVCLGAREHLCGGAFMCARLCVVFEHMCVYVIACMRVRVCFVFMLMRLYNNMPAFAYMFVCVLVFRFGCIWIITLTCICIDVEMYECVFIVLDKCGGVDGCFCINRRA